MVESRMLDAQYAILGAMIIDERCVPLVMGRLRERDFSDPQCRQVFLAIHELFSAQEIIDPVTISQRLAADGGDGMRQFLLQLMDVTPTAANVEEYIKILQEQLRIAKLQSFGLSLCSCSSSEAARKVLDEANTLFVERGKLRRMTMEQLLLDFYERHTSEHKYLTFGIPKLDRGIFVELGDMLVIGGYPSSGKTALALMMGYHLSQDLRVGFYSLETSDKKLADRLVASVTKLQMSDIKKGALSEEQWDQVVLKHHELPKRKLELIEAGGMSVAEIRADAVANRFDVVIIDYLQLIVSSGRGTRAEEVAEISLGLHTMSQRNKITVIALSQLSRPERNKGGSTVAPTMQSLRESGQIEQDADCVLLIYEDDPKNPAQRCLKIAKNKEGERGKIGLYFDGPTQSFSELAPTDNSVAKQYSDIGKQIRQLQRTSPQMEQTFFEIHDDSDLPFPTEGGLGHE